MKMREEPKGQIYAREFDCTRCKRKGKKTPAVVFVGLNDPDGTQYPMCRKHTDEWHYDVLLAMHGMGATMREQDVS